MTMTQLQTNSPTMLRKGVLALLISASAANYRQLSVQHKHVYRLHG